MSTYETNVNNNNVYEEELDNSSETSKDNYSSSASSFVIDETKKVTVEDKDERSLSFSKRKKRHSFISMFNPKKDDKDEKENGLVRSISGIFNKDKDNNKRNNNTVENQRRPTSRTSSNSDKNGNGRGFVFYSDDEEKPENDTTPKKGRQSSNAETLEKEKSKKRISVNLGKFFESKPSSKPKNMFDEDSFLEPGETTIKSPSSSKKHDKKNNNKNVNNNNNNNNNNSNNNDNNNNNNNIESHQIHDSIIANSFPPKNTDDSPVDDIQSTISFTHQNSFDDQEISSNNNNNIYYNNSEYEYNSGSPTTPKTPRLIVTPTDPESSPFEFTDINRNEKDDMFDQNNNTVNSIIGPNSYETKERIFTPLTISTNITKSNFIKRNSDDTITDTIEQHHVYDINNTTKTSQDLEEINKSLNNVKGQLEAKVAEQDVQITKFNSMEHIMQQQMDLSRRMTETMQRLESKVNVQKDDVDGTSISKVFEETIRRLESKIDSQNEEILKLKSVVGQLSGGSQQLLLTNGDISHFEDQTLVGALIQPQLPQTYSRDTLVSTLVVKPLYNTITVSASIATSVLYAVYVRPVVGLVSVFRDGISTNYETKN